MTRQETLQTAKPILFNTDMVRAILDGRKTVTRRVIKLDSHDDPNEIGSEFVEEMYEPPYKIGDILYVRETWEHFDCEHCDGNTLTNEPLYDDCPNEQGGCYFYRADGVSLDGDARWHPSIHMPKEAARIFLRVTGVRAERLQDINYFGCIDEGISYKQYEKEIIKDFSELWNTTVKKSDLEKYGWNANPWVWVIEFERLEVM